MKVSVLGACGGIGQPLSLLLKNNEYIDELALYDIRLSQGVATDLSHINTNCRVQGYGKDQLSKALEGCDVVVIVAGIPRKPGMKRDDLFSINAGIVKGLVLEVGRYCPESRVLIVSNPINSTVPIAVETLKSIGKYQPGKVMGVTMLDLLRAETFLMEYARSKADGWQIEDVKELKNQLCVIGGHSDKTMVPVLLNKYYQRRVFNNDLEEYKGYIKRIKFGGEEVVKAKEGSGSATLSMALAGYNFIEIILENIKIARRSSQSNVSSCFVYLNGITNGAEAQELIRKYTGLKVEYFALPVELMNGTVKGINLHVLKEILETGSSYTLGLLKESVVQVNKDVIKGKQFGLQSKL
ncbi:hypothetical protein TBLA_0B09220 [Henningerozyma blattae CBS 6284]|uniref:Malate dehydrogenase n=1 Tax=Henningerozyma blattae (strain ATCC 34711 / CBS 6284 / DSM 70876 / NBRC 10599 / NRRL Y-10934 / UCD 77-7) TaxID=1071380 RepID=I2H037_HENB6|nr:hypothetical protein TBLA_0B09220 [Tetrapisispora blattae CBS 6284]CCH59739.1 hypothetical protein TBLA_0B09220 [Tetrapisispora blattae CBS 6284]